MASFVPPNDESDSKTVGRLKYFPNEKLGEGAFGCVYKGNFSGVDVAVKRILFNSGESDTGSVPSELGLVHFGRETWHVHLVRYLYEEHDEHFLYIAMELCLGTLEDLIFKKISVPLLDPNEEILRQITVGVQFLHSKQIVHRDIKPKNILVSDSGIVKLADFGLCKKKSEDATSFTFTGNSGSCGWAAPELFSEDVERFKFAVDVFSLGCVFCYVLTGGKHLFGDEVERMKNLTTGEIKNSVDDEHLRRLIEKMVSANPGNRPALRQILLKLMECLLKIYVVNLDEKDDEFIETIDRLAEIYTADDQTISWIKECMLLSVCKATSKNKLKCIKEVLAVSNALRIDVNSTDSEDRNALTALLEVSVVKVPVLLELAELLIDKQIDVNKKTWNGNNAIILGIMYFGLRKRKKGLLDLLKLLLENGADPNVLNKEDWNPVNLACRYYQMDDLIDVLKLLINEYETRATVRRSASGHSALTLLTRHYQHDNLADVISVLVEAGVNVNWKTNVDNWNALMGLCRYYENLKGLVPAVKLLVQEGVNVNERNKERWTALHFVTRYFGNNRNERLSDVVRILLEKDAHQADVTNKNGWTPLHYACVHYQREDLSQVISLLKKRGARADRKDPDGNYPRDLVTKYYTLENKTDVLGLL